MIVDPGCCLRCPGYLAFGLSPASTADMERDSSSDMLPKREQKDKELDKKIEALRRKNQALMRRYQEVEEDKKKAEEEGKALQSRKGKADDLTITIKNSTTEPRVVVTRPGTGQCEEARESCSQGAGRARTRQLLVTMVGKHTKGGKRVVSERMTRRAPGTLNQTLEDRPPRAAPEDRRAAPEDRRAAPEDRRAALEDRTRPLYGGETGAQDELRQDKKQIEECYGVLECESYYQDAELSPPSREEQEEYQRWKKEREQIDRERVARHKNAKGQWRRAWDLDKTDHMFLAKSSGERDKGPKSKGGKSSKKGHPKSDAASGGHHTRGKAETSKKVSVVGSKAKGKDRLTGRARRWDAGEDADLSRASKTSLEEFLQELDAMAELDGDRPSAERVTEGDLKTQPSPLLDVVNEEEEEEGEGGGEGARVKQLNEPPSSLPDSSLPDCSLPDSSLPDSSLPDSSLPDSSLTDSSLPDSPLPDRSRANSSLPDSSLPDSSPPDCSLPDSSPPDSSPPDSSPPDCSLPDSSLPDSSLPDSSLPDRSRANSSLPDSSPPDSSLPDCSLPDCSLPDCSLPDSSLPDSPLPDSPLPDSPLPDSSLPDCSLPDCSLPDSPLPDCSLPDSSPESETRVASHKSPEKKVRFSDELIHGAHHSNTRHKYQEPKHPATDTHEDADPEGQAQTPAGEAQTQSSSVGHGKSPQGPKPPAVLKTDLTQSSRDDVCSPAPGSPMEERACGPPLDVSLQHAKSSGRNTEELLDSSLSVLTLESGDMNTAHTTSNDKAREHGKIV